jgi:hypothetical protein
MSDQSETTFASSMYTHTQHGDNWAWSPEWDRHDDAYFSYIDRGCELVRESLNLGKDLGSACYGAARSTVNKAWHQNAIHLTYATETRRPCDLFDNEALMKNAEPIALGVMKKAAAGKVTKTPYVAWAHTHFQRHWASLVRGEFNGYGGTRAEQLCAARWLRLQLKELNVRDAHIASLTPMILSLAMIPTVDENAAADFEASPEYAAVTGTMSWIRRATRWCLGLKTPAARRTTFILPR